MGSFSAPAPDLLSLDDHYSRPNQLQLHIDGRLLKRLIETGAVVAEAEHFLMTSEQVPNETDNPKHEDRLAVAG